MNPSASLHYKDRRASGKGNNAAAHGLTAASGRWLVPWLPNGSLGTRSAPCTAQGCAGEYNTTPTRLMDSSARSPLMITISKMAGAVQPSATLAAGAKARQMRAEGVQVYDFSLGEPDFPTPEHICQAAYKAMLDGQTHYTAAAGIAELRGAVAALYQRTYGLKVTAEQVIVSCGAK